MYLQNKYTICYNSIIARARDRILEGYKEKHHIIPKSLGGTDQKDNLVALTGREHYICHLLLTKMVEGPAKHKMNKAAWMMMRSSDKTTGRDYKVNSRLYETFRKQHAQFNSSDERRKKTSETMKQYHSVNRWTDEMRQRAREKALVLVEQRRAAGLRANGTTQSNAKSTAGELNGFFGKKHTEESKAKMRKPKVKRKG